MPSPVAPALLAASLGLLLLTWCMPAAALYKVVQADGSVTYTDRPPVGTNARITQLGRNATPVATGTDPVLPPELRQVVARYPVTLYTSAECAPCESGRRLLVQRGVPYSERSITTVEDIAALERLVGGRSVPALTIGPQPLRGFSEADWGNYLDVAGYPRSSRLPRDWPPAEPQPLVQRSSPQPSAGPAAVGTVGEAATSTARPVAVPPPSESAPVGNSGVRF